MERIYVPQTRRGEGALEALTSANLADLYRAFAVPAPLRPLATPLLSPFARRFAEDLFACDARAAEVGLQTAMAEVLARYGVTLEAFGLEGLPSSGPLLITSNHPGLTDAPALLACLNRTDLKIVSAQRTLLEALPAIHSRLIVVNRACPRQTVKQVVQHLQAGGAVLTFPAAQIEPDPAVDAAGAEVSLARWSESVELFVRLEPRTRVVPALVSGVATPETLSHPLTVLHTDPAEKAWLAACLQVMLRRYRRNRVLVRFAPPLSPTAVDAPLRFVEVLRATRKLLAAG